MQEVRSYSSFHISGVARILVRGNTFRARARGESGGEGPPPGQENFRKFAKSILKQLLNCIILAAAPPGFRFGEGPGDGAQNVGETVEKILKIFLRK